MKEIINKSEEIAPETHKTPDIIQARDTVLKVVILPDLLNETIKKVVESHSIFKVGKSKPKFKLKPNNQESE